MKNKFNYSYSATDFARYHSGEMTATERYALEKAALRDPFLADALEGFEAAQTPVADVDALRQALAQRVEKEDDKKVYILKRRWVSIAAACLVVTLVGWLAYQLPFASQSPVALDSKKEAITKLNKAPTPDRWAADSANMPVQSPNQTRIVAETVQKKRVVKKPASSSDTYASARLAAPTVTVPSVYAERSDSVAVTALVMQQRVKDFSGTIIDTTGRAIPFASIQVAQTGARLQSDAEGRFRVSAPDTGATVTISAAGYQSQRQALTREADNQLVLKESNAALQEVVVTRYGVKKQRPNLQVQEGQLEPKEGWNRYNDYLAETLRVPEEMAEKPIEGEVSLTFDVNADGEAINIKVVKSLCDACDQKAIQLLKNGPKWKAGTKRRGRIVIRF